MYLINTVCPQLEPGSFIDYRQTRVYVSQGHSLEKCHPNSQLSFDLRSTHLIWPDDGYRVKAVVGTNQTVLKKVQTEKHSSERPTDFDLPNFTNQNALETLRTIHRF